MKKALIIVALFLVPFFSIADLVFSPDSDNIFENGTIDLRSPKTDTAWVADCLILGGSDQITGIGDAPELLVLISQCADVTKDIYLNHLSNTDFYKDFCQYSVTSSTTSVTVTRNNCEAPYEDRSGKQFTVNPSVENLNSYTSKFCPPDQYPSYVSSVYVDSENFLCYDPTQLSLLDSCGVNSGYEYLTIPVTQQSGCFEHSDGSMCKYDAVDIGGGNQYYALDLEGDCYSDNDLPSLDGTPHDLPTGEDCISFGGGVLGCPEDPSNVCTSGGVYAGGSVQNCQSGCGMVNDQFLCIDNDLDGDGLPDYNDPDIDGDGIPNDDDLDNDNDGKDDPIHGDKPGTNIPGSGDIQIDLTPVVNELKKLNESFSDGGQAKDLDHNQDLKNLNDAYQTKLTSLMGKTSSELGYTDSLNLGNSSGLSSRLPTNDCTVYNFHPAGKTISLDMCFVADKVKPLLSWLFGLLTAWHIFYTINKTLREGI